MAKKQSIPHHTASLDIHGSVTVGQTGQVVIPAKLRKSLKIKAGDSLLVFSKHGNVVCMIPERDASKMIAMYEQHLSAQTTMLKKLKSIKSV